MDKDKKGDEEKPPKTTDTWDTLRVPDADLNLEKDKDISLDQDLGKGL